VGEDRRDMQQHERPDSQRHGPVVTQQPLDPEVRSECTNPARQDEGGEQQSQRREPGDQQQQAADRVVGVEPCPGQDGDPRRHGRDDGERPGKATGLIGARSIGPGTVGGHRSRR
jgi:hypothetical protein